MRWLITNRLREGGVFGGKLGTLSFWIPDPDAKNAKIDQPSYWKSCGVDDFKAGLVSQANKFPDPVTTPPEDQKHLTLFVHGYDNLWPQVMQRYDTIAQQLFDGPNSMGELVCFDWPSKGSVLGYLPDRAEARKTGDDLTNVLQELYNWMEGKQVAAAADPNNACRAKTSIIAHSMGNYALEYAMNALWTRKNRPLLVSLMQEVLMVAADVDNDLFRSGDTVSHGDGEGLANLSYRITALYTGLDNVLGASAGLKHFGKRRLGRSGLDRTCPVPDNVWDVDCTDLFTRKVNGIEVHGEYFDPAETKIYALMREILKGKDRSILIKEELVPAAAPREQVLA
ncbi:MAG TPA: alpha/beta hydrolase [Terriglobales bacterium]|nr:alpha/beta hydrolase [Terriglobales bacterium]